MPYENEHACRLQDPKKYDEIRPGKDRVHAGKSYRVLYGYFKKDGKTQSEEQSFRYPTKQWESSAARAHCKDHNGSFHAAAEEKQSMNENTVTRRACLFVSGEIDFAEAKQSGARRFKIVGYSGKIIRNHWYWGNLAFDLAGLTFAKTKTPILEEHFTSARIGFTTKQDIEENVTVEGQFLPNTRAQQLADDLQEGFPMEASLYVPPTVVERVAEGASVEVNGQTLKGPGTVFRKAVIKEVSMCVFGADDKTQSVAAGQDDQSNISYQLVEDSIMAKEKTEMTVEQFALERPELYEQIVRQAKEEGQKASKDRFAELKTACGDDAELLVACFAQDRTVLEAQQARIEKLEKLTTEQAAKLNEKVLPKQDTGSPPVDPAVAAFNNTPKTAESKQFDEANATDEQLKEHFAATKELQDQFTGAEAYIACVRHPD